jgi:hypothetical protein
MGGAAAATAESGAIVGLESVSGNAEERWVRDTSSSKRTGVCSALCSLLGTTREAGEAQAGQSGKRVGAGESSFYR